MSLSKCHGYTAYAWMCYLLFGNIYEAPYIRVKNLLKGAI